MQKSSCIACLHLPSKLLTINLFMEHILHRQLDTLRFLRIDEQWVRWPDSFILEENGPFENSCSLILRTRNPDLTICFT